jgi:hypothetical protein
MEMQTWYTKIVQNRLYSALPIYDINSEIKERKRQ